MFAINLVGGFVYRCRNDKAHRDRNGQRRAPFRVHPVHRSGNRDDD